jgi:DnaJ-class molecular chaperone
MTPYAVLMVRPMDSDQTIRQQFHALAVHEHPDRPGAAGVPGPNWYTISGAYALIKTDLLRSAWSKHQSVLSGLCAGCSGSGVKGTRTAGRKIRVCEACNGEGRVVKPRRQK